MNEDSLVVTLNFDNTLSHFLRAIQHQLDVISILHSGINNVLTKEVQPIGFINFSPAHNTQLSHDMAKVQAMNWLNTCFLRDSIESTDQFIGRCLSFCFAMKMMKSEKKVTSQQLDEIVNHAPLKHNKLHLPAKLKKLNEEYAVTPQLSEHILSLNKIRTCLVHRLGRVTQLDTNQNDVLVAKWLSGKMILRGLQTGTEIELTEPGQGLDEESELEMRIVEHEQQFPIGTYIALTPHDIYSTIFTLWRFGLDCAAAIENYAHQSGVPVDKS